MKAIIQHEYGAPADVLQLGEMKKPAAAAGEVLVRVLATTVAGDDWQRQRQAELEMTSLEDFWKAEDRFTVLDQFQTGPDATIPLPELPDAADDGAGLLPPVDSGGAAPETPPAAE